MQLLLPPEENSQDWQDFKYAIAELGLSLQVIERDYKSGILVQINTESEHLKDEIVSLIKLCFSRYYIA